jgi:Ca-activated chloride channel family protein
MKIGQDFEILHPVFLWLLLLLPAVAYWLKKTRHNERPYMLFSLAGKLKNTRTYRNLLHKIIPLLLMLTLFLMVVAMARPRNVESGKHVKKTKGVDIVLAIDVSGSMLARDLKPNRLEALKRTAIEFVNRRPNDRFGVVLYAGEAFTKVPLTSDKRIVINAIKEIDFFKLFNQIEQGTAIGMGLAVAVNRIKDSKAKSKVIILMTDGVNNTGAIDPDTALELAKEYGIKVYTIGIGTNGIAPFPVANQNNVITGYRMQPVEIDEKLLKKIARETGGKYYRATDNKKLKEIYKEIDKLEKTVVEEIRFYNYTELYRYLLIPVLVLLLSVWIVRQVVLKSQI